ncbi:lipopolysaccharide biosynthesis protein [Citricoccus nitrophenolicus]|uniref:lipopolysaccharide biosynthesis protein n=1 Tax=Citricoccus nitrophenolicus TaxID=863575 RepID=UPI0031EB9467
MRQHWNRAFNSPAARIALGLAIGQGAIFASTPWLTRLYGPESFGIMTVGLSIAGICATFGSLRVELLIPRLESEEVPNATRLASLTLFIAAVIGAAVMLITVQPGLVESLLVGTVAYFVGGAAVHQQSRIRFEKLGRIGLAKATQGVGQVLSQASLAMILPTAAGLMAGLATGHGLSYGLLRGRQQERATAAAAFAFGRRHWRQMLRLTMAATLNAVTVAFLPLIIAVQFGNEETGQFAVVHRLAVVPVGLMVAALSPVIIAATSSLLRNNKSTLANVRSWIIRLSFIGVLAGTVLLIFPEQWTTMLLGEKFTAAHAYFAPLAPMIASQLVVGPLSALLAIFKRDRTQLVWDFCRFLTVTGTGIGLGAVSQDPIVTVWGISVVITVFYVIYLVLLLRATRKS